MFPVFATILIASGITAVAVAVYYIYDDSFLRTTRTEVSELQSKDQISLDVEGTQEGSLRTQSTQKLRSSSPQASASASMSSVLSPVRHIRTPCPGEKGKVVETVSSLRLCTDVCSKSPKSKSPKKANALSPATSTALSCATSRASVCDCRLVEDSLTMLSDNESKFIDGMRFKTSKTKIMPIDFRRYKPLDLTKMSENDMQSGLCDEARAQDIPEVEHSILTAFRPILHCVLYSAKHAFLLSELLQEYEYSDN